MEHQNSDVGGVCRAYARMGLRKFDDGVVDRAIRRLPAFVGADTRLTTSDEIRQVQIEYNHE